MGFSDSLIPKLGRVPDSVLALEAGITEGAVRKQRKKRGISAYTKAVKWTGPQDPDEDADREPPWRPSGSTVGVALARIPFLENRLQALLDETTPNMPGYAASMKLQLQVHAELEAERKAAAPREAKMTPAELLAEHARESSHWPDQILEVHTETYCDRHGYVLTPKNLVQ